MFKMTVEGDGLAVITADLAALAGRVHERGLAKALNRVGDKVETRTVRLLAKQTGVDKSLLFKNGRVLSIGRAAPGHLRYEFKTRGKAIKAIELKHRVYARSPQKHDARGRFMPVADGAKGGVKLVGWAQGKVVKSGFKIAAGVDWGAGQKKADGLYYRPDKDVKGRFGFRTMYGANINKQVVSDETAAAFQAIVEGPSGLPYEVNRELRQILRGFG